MLPKDGLRQHYLINHNLLYHHHIDPRIFDDMMPWERDIELNFIIKEVEEENLAQQTKQAKQRSRNRPVPPPIRKNK